MLDRLLIICWHNVDGAYSAPFEPGQGPAGFLEQIRWLARVGRVVDLDEGMRRLREGSLGPRGIALTFDDGYRDNLEVAAPLLERHGLPATVYLVPEFLDGTREPWWERLAWTLEHGRRDGFEWGGTHRANADVAERTATYQRLGQELKRLTQDDRAAAINEIVERAEPTSPSPARSLMLDWDGARGLIRHGISIGGHASGHAVLANERPEVQHADLARCRQVLEAELSVPITSLAYPNGGFDDYDAASVAAAQAAGFRWAATGMDGWNRASTPPYELRRIFVDVAAGARGLAYALKRWWDPRTTRRGDVGTHTPLV